MVTETMRAAWWRRVWCEYWRTTVMSPELRRPVSRHVIAACDRDATLLGRARPVKRKPKKSIVWNKV